MFSSWPDGNNGLTCNLSKSRETETSTSGYSSSDDGSGRWAGVGRASDGSGSVGTVPVPVSVGAPPFPAFFEDFFDLLLRPVFPFPFEEAGWTTEEEDAESKAAGPCGYPSPPVVVAVAEVEVEDAVTVEVEVDDVVVDAAEVADGTGVLKSVSSALKRSFLAAALSASVPGGAWMVTRPLVVGREDSSKVTVRWRSLSRT